MRGYIIYNTEDLTKNKRFIKFITETLNEYNIDVELVIIDRVELAELENPDFVINRSRNADVSRYFEGKNDSKYFHFYTDYENGMALTVEFDKKTTKQALADRYFNGSIDALNNYVKNSSGKNTQVAVLKYDNKFLAVYNGYVFDLKRK